MSLRAGVLGFALLWASAAAAEVRVEITSPAAGESIFDEVEISAAVGATEEVVRVEFFVDGELAGVKRRPPYRVKVDVGSKNRDREILVVAHGRSGATGRARRVAPRIAVDEEVELDLQQLYVTVTDRRGRRVLDLERGSFAIRDEKRPQEIVTFARGDIPFTAVLLVDGSWSMRGRRLRTALEGARRFVAGMRPLDEAKLMVYSDRLLEITPWSRSAEPLERSLETTVATGGTAILDHLYLALTLLEARLGRRVVVLLSDGWDLQSVLTARQLRSVARRSQAILYWVRVAGDEPRSEGGHLVRPSFTRGSALTRRVPLSTWRDEETARDLYEQLEKTVLESGGRIESISGVDQVGATFEDILAELREQYALGYYPDPRRNDGSWREVQVRLAERGLKLRTRDGYVDR